MSLRHLGASMVSVPTAAQGEVLMHVVELAQAWQAGALPLEQMKEQCTGFERFTAMRCAGLGTAQKASIAALMNALCALQESSNELYWTDHGWFSRDEIREVGGHVTYREGGQRVIHVGSRHLTLVHSRNEW